MSGIGTIKTIASTLTIAAAVGFVVQYGEQSQAGSSTPRDDTAGLAPQTMMMATNENGQAVFGVPDVAMAPTNHAANHQPIVAVDAVYMELAVPELGTVMATPQPDCETRVQSSRQIAAMVEIRIEAPCFEEASFVVAHEGMRVSAVTDRDGRATLQVPALVTNAIFAVFFDNVLQGETRIFVPELRQYDRAVLQWRNENNMRLHALENGAQIGDAGHVWSASIHSAEDTRAGRHGFVLYVGDVAADVPFQAEVYTFPAGQMNRDGGVDLQIGVRLNEDNCGREVDARTIQTNAGGMLVKADIAAQMPSCEQVGEVVFLTDQFADLTQ